MKENFDILIGNQTIHAQSDVNGVVDILFDVDAHYTENGGSPTALTVDSDGSNVYTAQVGIENGFDMTIRTFQVIRYITEELISILNKYTMSEFTTLKPFLKGDSRRYKLIMQDSNEDPLDLTGYQCLMTFKKNETTSAILAQVVGTVGGTDNNEVEFFLTHDKSKKLCVLDISWDMQLKKEQECITPRYGTVEVKQDITI